MKIIVITLIIAYLLIGITLAAVEIFPKTKDEDGNYKTFEEYVDSLDALETAGSVVALMFLLFGWPLWIIVNIINMIMTKIFNFIFTILRKLN